MGRDRDSGVKQSGMTGFEKVPVGMRFFRKKNLELPFQGK